MHSTTSRLLGFVVVAATFAGPVLAAPVMPDAALPPGAVSLPPACDESWQAVAGAYDDDGAGGRRARFCQPDFSALPHGPEHAEVGGLPAAVQAVRTLGWSALLFPVAALSLITVLLLALYRICREPKPVQVQDVAVGFACGAVWVSLILMRFGGVLG